MGTIRFISKTITESAESIKWVATNGNIALNTTGEIIQQSKYKARYDEYKPIADNEAKDFNIAFSLNKIETTVVPLGILDFNNEYENPYFAFDYALSLNDIDALEFQIKDADGNVIYQLTNLAPVVVTASKVPQIKNDIKNLLPAYPTKTPDFKTILEQFSLSPADYTKIGSYVIYWDGFDNDEVYDSIRFNNKKLSAKITAIKAGKRKSLEVEFSTHYEQVDWVDIKIDRKKNRIDTTLRVNLKDGGAEGLECWQNTRNFNSPHTKSEICDWDKVSREALTYYNKSPIRERTQSYEDLEKLTLQGINQFWSRNLKNIGGGVKIISETYQVYVDAKVDKNGLSAPSIVYQTNSEESRSRNFELSRKLFFTEGYLYRNDWNEYPNSILYSNLGWEYKAADAEDFKMTAAHEIGHEILLAYGGHIYSKTHKGSSHWSMIFQDPSSSATNSPIYGEIDLMKYYKNYYDIPRTIIAEIDLLKLLWLTKIKII